MRFLTRAFVAAVAVCIGATVGLAFSKTVRSDNAFTFSYNAEDDTIDYAVSSRRMYRRDGPRTTLSVYVDQAPGSKKPRLEGRVVLTQHSKKERNYEGTLRLVIRSGEDVAYKDSAKVDWTLGGDHRSRSHKFRFDLPTGQYSASGVFRSTD